MFETDKLSSPDKVLMIDITTDWQTGMHIWTFVSSVTLFSCFANDVAYSNLE